nr:MAG TPA: hypothetical protein [Caudoviricetes sp.]
MTIILFGVLYKQSLKHSKVSGNAPVSGDFLYISFF